MRQILAGMAISLLLIACGGPKAYVDYDDRVNFDQFDSYAFYTDMQTGLTELDEDRLQAALSEALSEKDIQASETPAMKVNFYAESFERPNNTSIGVGAIGGGVSSAVGSDRLYLSVTIEFTKAENDELFWQVIVEDRFYNDWTPNERDAFFKAIAEKALDQFPPEQ